jgi:hypothetical protein
MPSLRPLRLHGLAILLGVVLAMGAWGWRNAQVCGDFFTGSSHDGITLWESNYPYAAEAVLTYQVAVLNNEKMLDDFVRTADMTEHDADRYFRDRAVAHIRAHPIAVLRTGGLKTALTLAGIQTGQSWTSWRNLVAMTASALLYALALAGAIHARPGRPWSPTVRLCGVYFGLVTAAVIGMLIIGPYGIRYRLSLEGILWIAAGAALAAVLGSGADLNQTRFRLCVPL